MKNHTQNNRKEELKIEALELEEEFLEKISGGGVQNVGIPGSNGGFSSCGDESAEGIRRQGVSSCGRNARFFK